MSQLSIFDRLPQTKWCPWCKRWRRRSEFGRARHLPDGRQQVCRECQARNWRKNHNVADEPPVPRKSPYDVMEEVLLQLELLAEMEGARLVIDHIYRVREELKLD